MSFWNTDVVKEHLRKKKGRREPPKRWEKTLQGLVSITPYQRPYTREQRQAPRCQSANGRGVNIENQAKELGLDPALGARKLGQGVQAEAGSGGV